MTNSDIIAQIYNALLPYWNRDDESLVQTAQRLVTERAKLLTLLTDAQIIIADYRRSHQLETGCDVDGDLCDNCRLADAWLVISEQLVAGAGVSAETARVPTLKGADAEGGPPGASSE